LGVSENKRRKRRTGTRDVRRKRRVLQVFALEEHRGREKKETDYQARFLRRTGRGTHWDAGLKKTMTICEQPTWAETGRQTGYRPSE